MKKGFTLLELLATIIVLGVLAIITFSTVNKSIQNSKEKSLESTINNLIDSAKSYVLEYDTLYSNEWNIVGIKKLKTEGYLANKVFINPVTNEEMDGCIKYKWNDSVKQYEFEWTDSCPICKRANVKTLHTELCDYSSASRYCTSVGYTSGSTITYGNTIVTNEMLTSGDAFDCDVDGDGIYDHNMERFYYVSGKDGNENSEYAVLIYYNNTYQGESNNTSSSLIAYDISNESWHGPRTAIANLPTINQWPNVSLSSVTRAITTDKYATSVNGNTLPTAFSYTNLEGVSYSARLITFQEVAQACGGDGRPTAQGGLKGCIYLLENTKYSSDSIVAYGYWLETPNPNYPNQAWYIRGSNLDVFSKVVTDSLATGVRPVIEVLKSDIAY